MKHSHRLHTILIAVLVVALCLSIVPVITMAAQNTRTNNEIGFPTTAQDNPAEEEEGDIRVPIGSLPTTESTEPSTEPTKPEGVLGDFTDDGLVTNDDVVYLLWHTLFNDQFPITGRGDFTDDSLVNNDDVVYLLWHTLFNDQFPLV